MNKVLESIDKRRVLLMASPFQEFDKRTNPSELKINRSAWLRADNALSAADGELMFPHYNERTNRPEYRYSVNGSMYVTWSRSNTWREEGVTYLVEVSVIVVICEYNTHFRPHFGALLCAPRQGRLPYQASLEVWEFCSLIVSLVQISTGALWAFLDTLCILVSE